MSRDPFNALARQQMIARSDIEAGVGTSEDKDLLEDYAGGVVGGPLSRPPAAGGLGCLPAALAVGLVLWLLLQVVVVGARGLMWVATDSPAAGLFPTLDTSVMRYVVSTLVLLALGPVPLLLAADHLDRSGRVVAMQWLLRGAAAAGVPVVVVLGVTVLAGQGT